MNYLRCLQIILWRWKRLTELLGNEGKFFFFWYNKKETETGNGHKLHPKRHAAKQSISILITPVYFAGFTFADH
jgi:hypothetical protein